MIDDIKIELAANAMFERQRQKLREALKPFADQYESICAEVHEIHPFVDDLIVRIQDLEQARAALACRPQPPRSRPLPEMRCDCCDNGLDDAWEFCPFCGTQHPDATGEPPDGR
jgi:hypothetical protein